MVEVLAPAGGMEQLIAAVRCGADAVYLGAGGFNARAGAENFGEGRLKDAVSYAHVRGVKVHVTVNTLVMDDEYPDLDATLEEIAAAGPDAAIIQDLGVNARFRDRLPDLPRHASTQMTVHNLDGAKLASDLGFSRVVLARELTLKEIEFITARCGIETEVFIHGALCMCMSGQCYLSSVLGGRSGNRGRCAQPCRLDFHNSERGYALSLKDMSHLKYARDLANAGVSSFKIEGRMKRPEYVAAAVTALRAALRGEPWDEESLRAVFSRSGFTDGYATGRRDVTMFGARQREDVTAAAPVLGKLSALYRWERPSAPVDFALTVDTDKTELLATCQGETATVSGDPPKTAKNRPTTAEDARKSLQKTGGTPYFPRNIFCKIAENVNVSASFLNQLRRSALEELTRRRAQPRAIPLFPGKPPRDPRPYRAAKSEIWCRFEHISQIPADLSTDRVILPLEEVEKRREIVEKLGEKLTVGLPSLFFDTEKGDLRERLEKFKTFGGKSVLSDTLYGIKTAKDAGLSVIGGAGLNILSTFSLNELQDLGVSSTLLSFELSFPKISDLGGALPRGILAYGRLPLMKFRACPVKKRSGCGKCPGISQLTDRKGVKFPVLCHERQYGVLLNSVPLHIAGKSLPKVDFFLLDFTIETPDQVRRVLSDYEARRPAEGERTGGLYFRQIL